MSFVHFKFKSGVDYDKVTFDGVAITLADLKKAIMAKKKGGQTAGFDLQVTNSQTKEVYKDDNSQIPRNSSVIVARIPIGGKSLGSASVYSSVKTTIAVESSSPLSYEQLSQTANLASAHGSEDDKIMAMMKQATQDYDSSNYVKPKFPSGVPHASYICFKCGLGGHYIHNCTVVKQVKPDGSSGYHVEKVRRSTGIPQSFLKPVAGPEIKGALLTNQGHYAVPRNDLEAYIKGKKEKPPFVEQSDPVDELNAEKNIPGELLCLLCKDILTDAVVISCCGNSFCDECIRDALLETPDHSCPTCPDSGISPDSLIPNKFLRKAVDNFKNETGYTKAKAREESPPPPPPPPEPKVDPKPQAVRVVTVVQQPAFTSSASSVPAQIANNQSMSQSMSVNAHTKSSVLGAGTYSPAQSNDSPNPQLVTGSITGVRGNASPAQVTTNTVISNDPSQQLLQSSNIPTQNMNHQNIPTQNATSQNMQQNTLQNVPPSSMPSVSTIAPPMGGMQSSLPMNAAPPSNNMAPPGINPNSYPQMNMMGSMPPTNIPPPGPLTQTPFPPPGVMPPGTMPPNTLPPPGTVPPPGPLPPPGRGYPPNQIPPPMPMGPMDPRGIAPRFQPQMMDGGPPSLPPPPGFGGPMQPGRMSPPRPGHLQAPLTKEEFYRAKRVLINEEINKSRSVEPNAVIQKGVENKMRRPREHHPPRDRSPSNYAGGAPAHHRPGPQSPHKPPHHSPSKYSHSPSRRRSPSPFGSHSPQRSPSTPLLDSRGRSHSLTPSRVLPTKRSTQSKSWSRSPRAWIRKSRSRTPSEIRRSFTPQRNSAQRSWSPKQKHSWSRSPQRRRSISPYPPTSRSPTYYRDDYRRRPHSPYRRHTPSPVPYHSTRRSRTRSPARYRSPVRDYSRRPYSRSPERRRRYSPRRDDSYGVGPNAASNEAWTEWAKGYIDSSSHSRSRPAYTSSRSTYNKYPSPHRRRSRSTSRSRIDYKDSYYKDSYDRNYTPDRHVDKKYKEKHDKSYYDDERVGKVSKKKHDKSEKRKHKNDSKKEKNKSKSEKTSKKRKEKVSQSTTSDSNTESRPPRVKKSKTDSVSQKSKHARSDDDSISAFESEQDDTPTQDERYPPDISAVDPQSRHEFSKQWEAEPMQYKAQKSQLSHGHPAAAVYNAQPTVPPVVPSLEHGKATEMSDTLHVAPRSTTQSMVPDSTQVMVPDSTNQSTIPENSLVSSSSSDVHSKDNHEMEQRLPMPEAKPLQDIPSQVTELSGASKMETDKHDLYSPDTKNLVPTEMTDVTLGNKSYDSETRTRANSFGVSIDKPVSGNDDIFDESTIPSPVKEEPEQLQLEKPFMDVVKEKVHELQTPVFSEETPKEMTDEPMRSDENIGKEINVPLQHDEKTHPESIEPVQVALNEQSHSKSKKSVGKAKPSESTEKFLDAEPVKEVLKQKTKEKKVKKSVPKKSEFEPELSKWEREDYDPPTSKSPTAAQITKTKNSLPKSVIESAEKVLAQKVPRGAIVASAVSLISHDKHSPKDHSPEAKRHSREVHSPVHRSKGHSPSHRERGHSPAHRERRHSPAHRERGNSPSHRDRERREHEVRDRERREHEARDRDRREHELRERERREHEIREKERRDIEVRERERREHEVRERGRREHEVREKERREHEARKELKRRASREKDKRGYSPKRVESRRIPSPRRDRTHSPRREATYSSRSERTYSPHRERGYSRQEGRHSPQRKERRPEVPSSKDVRLRQKEEELSVSSFSTDSSDDLEDTPPPPPKKVPKRQVSMDEHVDRQKERSRDKKLSVKVTIDARSDKRRTLPPASKSERTVEKSKPKDDSRTVVHMDSESRGRDRSKESRKQEYKSKDRRKAVFDEDDDDCPREKKILKREVEAKKSVQKFDLREKLKQKEKKKDRKVSTAYDDEQTFEPDYEEDGDSDDHYNEPVKKKKKRVSLESYSSSDDDSDDEPRVSKKKKKHHVQSSEDSDNERSHKKKKKKHKHKAKKVKKVKKHKKDKREIYV